MTKFHHRKQNLVGRLFGREFGVPAASLGIAALLAAGSVAAAMTGTGSTQPTDQAAVAPPPPPGTVWLDQGWSASERLDYHHQSQGTLTLPIPWSWFVALQQPALTPRAGLFSDPDYLSGFGFIPSVRDPRVNPDGLPIGFARTTGTDPRTGRAIDGVGFTCAACHTGQIKTGAYTLLIDGGPALIDLQEFGTQLALALGETAISPTRFRRFADRVLGAGHSAARRQELHREISAVLRQGLGELLQNHKSGNVGEGAGRLDALNRIGNTVFGDGMGIRENYVATTAPVAYPHIWDTSWFDWVQYNGSIEQPMVRNAGEAMGVSAIVNFKEGPTPRFTSTVAVGALHDNIELLLAGKTPPTSGGGFSGLRSPAWPENILPRIDRTLATRGAAIYRDRCQGCHLPATNTQEFWTGSHWTAPNEAGERYLRLPMIPIDRIGTDPAQARDMMQRTVLVPADMPLTPLAPVRTSGNFNVYPYGPALGQVVERVVNRWYDSQTPPTPAAERARMNGNRPNGIRAMMSYKARPLNGIWATAPYLHNGSVPTLWALLSPYSERPQQFRLGNTQFDPVKVGYVDGGGTRIDTRIAGNRNTGHLFETPANGAQPRPGTIGPTIAPDDRRALIEYLKTL